MGGVVNSIGRALGPLAAPIGGAIGFAVGGPAGAAIGSSIGGALSSGNAAQDAARAQVNASRNALELQRAIYESQLAQQAPFREAGLTAQNRLLDYLGLSQNRNAKGFGRYARDFSMSDFQQDPGYQFRLSEGLKALDRQAAARGGLISGAALKASQRYGQDMASQEYQNAFNRYQINRSNQLNPLQSLMGSSQTATNVMGAAGQNYAGQGADLYTGIGNARASGYVGQANAMNNLINQGIGLYGMTRGGGGAGAGTGGGPLNWSW